MKSKCLKGSAWETWQLAGEKNKGEPMEKITAAAHKFAYIDGDEYPLAGQQARYKAFMEGALS